MRLSPRVAEWMRESHGQGDGEMAVAGGPGKAAHVEALLEEVSLGEEGELHIRGCF